MVLNHLRKKLKKHLVPLNRFSEGNQIWLASIGRQQNNFPHSWDDFFIPTPFIISKLAIKKTNFDSYHHIDESHKAMVILNTKNSTRMYEFDVVCENKINYASIPYSILLDYNSYNVYKLLLKECLYILNETWSGINGVKRRDAFNNMLQQCHPTLLNDYPELLF